MESSTQQRPEQQPDAVTRALPPDAPEALQDAARGGKQDGEGERSALDYLLGATFRPEYTTTVKFETRDGERSVIFHLHALDESRHQEIDKANRSGTGPFAELDTASYNAQLVAESTKYVIDATGRRVEPASEEFRGGAPTAPIAMGLRFKYQPGILESLATEARRISGYSADRVSPAQRVIAEAVGNS